ncbi:uncharacterized protein LOC122243683 [Penaeus japonicus]|uniref:uncharacterized protein LOC122243683 n=1 Tax=Penaeus japonicus TaxID=27405 RepID=UPI001C70B24A|nr:uncharacterized protein LOC122243683 [Penaeus japonicus]
MVPASDRPNGTRSGSYAHPTPWHLGLPGATNGRLTEGIISLVMKASAVAVAVLVSLQLASCGALAGYPGTFYQMMLRLNKGHKNPVKNARTVSSPSQLWAILDPPAALGSLWNEPINSNRIVRSAEFDASASRQLFDDVELRTDAPEETDTEAPAEATEAPVVCGGEILPTLLETGRGEEDKLLINTTVETPGYNAGGYPADIECIWNANVDSGCAQGFVTWQINSGVIRSSRGCSQDYLEVGFDGVVVKKHCGSLSDIGGAKLWADATSDERSLNMRFLAAPRDENEGGANGFQIQILGYCSTYSEEYIAAAAEETATEAVTEVVTEALRNDLDQDYNVDYAEDL